MSRISRDALVRAVSKMQAMDRTEREQLADEIFREQPHLFGSFLVQTKFGVAMEKMEFLLEILFVCFQTMKESGHRWPLITEDDLDRQMERFVATVKFGEELSENLKQESMRQFVVNHPEVELVAYVQMETTKWLARIVPAESDKYVMLAAWNMVNCIAHAAFPSGRDAVNAMAQPG